MARAKRDVPGLPVLKTEQDLKDAIGALVTRCRIMKAVHARTGTPPLRDFTADFAGLSRIVVGQQLSASSAAAIWGRLSAALTPFEPGGLLAMSDAALKAPGLSGGKIKTIRAIARAADDGSLVFEALNALPDAAIVSELTRLNGIGPWTAEIYLLFALRRADAFPAGDLALQLAAQSLFKLEEKPSAQRLTELSERWRPWRGAAARLLWAEYALRGPRRPPARAANSCSAPKS